MNIASRIHRSCLLVGFAGILTACGGGQPVPSASEAAIAEQILFLERSGQLPTLDRSSDIRGPDVDGNGIRDDIDAWILAQSITETQKQAVLQAARVRQLELEADLEDAAALDDLGRRSMASVKCLRLAFWPNYQRGYDLGATVEALTANTKGRAFRYMAYNRAVSGTSGSLPSGNTCDS